MGSDHEHRVCTFDEAEKAIKAHDAIYVNDCFCRGPAKAGEAKWDYCGHPTEVCMGFKHSDEIDFEYECKEITQVRALELFEDWKKLGNFFRFMEDEDWICFCCKCGCSFFRDKEGNWTQDTGDKSPFIEKTDMDKCNLCGLCIDVCAYEARTISDDKMVVVSEKCSGCSACDYACLEDAIVMIPRA